MIQRYDISGIHKVYDKWPQLARESYSHNSEPLIDNDIHHIVFAGMGGSGTIGDLFFSLLSQTNIFVSVVKGYHLPKNVDKNTLVVITSVSGNTLETLNTLKEAFETNCKIIAFSSGGNIEKYCNERNISHIKVVQHHSPRASFPLYVYAILRNLEPLVPLSSMDIQQSFEILEKTKNNISSENLTLDNPSLNLAIWLSSSIPIIYYPWGLQTAAIRFKNSLQENAKTHAIVENVIEACHNGIVAWEKKSSIKPILLRGQDDFFKTKERWSILKKFFSSNGIDYKEIKSSHGNILTKLVNLVYVLDYSSIYSAIISKTDPSPVKSINYIKNLLTY